MVNNDMCSQIKGDAGESRICAGGKRGEGVCDVRVTCTRWNLKPSKSNFYGFLSSLRKTTAVRWFARNTSAKSSSVWASSGPNAPRRSRRFSWTSPSTRSGYIKCLNFTPTRRRTDGVLWKRNCEGLDRRRGDVQAKKIPKTSPARSTRDEWGKSPYGKWPFWDFALEFVRARTYSGWVIEGWIQQTESVLPLCKWRHFGCRAECRFYHQRSWHADGVLIVFWHVQSFWSQERVLSPGIYLKMDTTQVSGLPFLLLFLNMLPDCKIFFQENLDFCFK